MTTYPPKEVQIQRAIEALFRARGVRDEKRCNANETTANVSQAEHDSSSSNTTRNKLIKPARRRRLEMDKINMIKSSVAAPILQPKRPPCIIIIDDDDDIETIDTTIAAKDSNYSRNTADSNAEANREKDEQRAEAECDERTEEEVAVVEDCDRDDNPLLIEQLDHPSAYIDDDTLVTRPRRKRKSKGCIMCESLLYKN